MTADLGFKSATAVFCFNFVFFNFFNHSAYSVKFIIILYLRGCACAYFCGGGVFRNWKGGAQGVNFRCIHFHKCSINYSVRFFTSKLVPIFSPPKRWVGAKPPKYAAVCWYLKGWVFRTFRMFFYLMSARLWPRKQFAPRNKIRTSIRPQNRRGVSYTAWQ